MHTTAHEASFFRSTRWSFLAFLQIIFGCLLCPPAYADEDDSQFCHFAWKQSVTAKQAVDSMIIALNDATDQVEDSNWGNRDNTISRVQLKIRDLRFAAAQQLRMSAQSIEDLAPDDPSNQLTELAKTLISAQSKLADTILYQDYNTLGNAVDSLNEKSDAFFTQCDVAPFKRTLDNLEDSPSDSE